jgi:carbonic anhydrase/acetyltransferase-like protein (isoleucine patch superfamily)
VPTLPYRNVWPKLAPDVEVALNAYVIGQVQVGAGSRIANRAVLRGDQDAIVVGQRVVIEEGTTLHVDPGVPCRVGDDVVIGAGSCVHGCTVGANVLIGPNVMVLTGATIGAESIIAPSALVPNNVVVPPRSIVEGVPGRVVRTLSDAEAAALAQEIRARQREPERPAVEQS